METIKLEQKEKEPTKEELVQALGENVLTTEEKAIFDAGVETYRAQKKYDEIEKTLLEKRGLGIISDQSYVSALADYKKKPGYNWEELQNKFLDELNKLPKEAEDKLKDKVQNEARRLGFWKNPYTGEYSKPTLN